MGLERAHLSETVGFAGQRGVMRGPDKNFGRKNGGVSGCGSGMDEEGRLGCLEESRCAHRHVPERAATPAFEARHTHVLAHLGRVSAVLSHRRVHRVGGSDRSHRAV